MCVYVVESVHTAVQMNVDHEGEMHACMWMDVSVCGPVDVLMSFRTVMRMVCEVLLDMIWAMLVVVFPRPFHTCISEGRRSH